MSMLVLSASIHKIEFAEKTAILLLLVGKSEEKIFLSQLPSEIIISDGRRGVLRNKENFDCSMKILDCMESEMVKHFSDSGGCCALHRMMKVG